MITYKNGHWGFGFLWKLSPSPFPRAFVLAFPNAVIAYVLSDIFQPNPEPDQEKLAFSLWAGFTSVLGFLLYFRGQKAYSRWWEGGTLLQQVRGEWFNAYSSLIAFCSPDAAKQDTVDEFQHLLGRLMSLLFCAALQQVSPQQRGRSFEIIEIRGIDSKSLNFLATSPDSVEVIIQWIQRSTVLNMGSGVLHVPPPVLSRVFQELSRGIVNLQNARKIAEFPFPFPFAQTSVVMLIIHWVVSPIIIGLMLEKFYAAGTSFTLTFFLWCVNYISLQLEMPYGEQPNDLPLDQMQADWNRSLSTLLSKAAQCPPQFHFDKEFHSQLRMSNSAHAFQAALLAVQEEDMKKNLSNGDSKSDGGSVTCATQIDLQVKEAKELQEMPAVPVVVKEDSLTRAADRPLNEACQYQPPVLKAKDPPILFDPPGKTPPLDPQDVGVIGACGGTITCPGLERDCSQSGSVRPTSAPRSFESERRPSRATPGPHSTMNGHPPPWTLEVGNGSGRSSMQCSAGCLQALVRLRPGAPGASIHLGS